MLGSTVRRQNRGSPRSHPLVSTFRPGPGTPGGMMSGFETFATGVSGMRGADPASTGYSITPGAAIDPRFAEGQPGTYVITMVVEGVKLSEATISLHSPAPYNKALQAQGINGTVTNVRYVGNRNVRDENWAASTLQDVFGDSVSEGGIADLVFDVTVQIFGTPYPQRSAESPSESEAQGMEGMGVVQIGVGAVFAIIAVVAVVLAVAFPNFQKMVLDGIRFVGNVLGEAIGGASKAIASNFIPILGVVAIGALSIWMLKKGGAKYASKSGRFSF